VPEQACQRCGQPLPEAAAFCPDCGAATQPPGPAAQAGPSPVTSGPRTFVGTEPAAPDTKALLGEALGAGYEVRGLLGRGGLAEVFEVWDKGLSRRLAVKVLRPDVAWTAGMLARFREECRVLASLNHPNILPIHFVGEGQGLTYYVMPFVEGQSLGAYLRHYGALEVDQALDIAVPILEALSHAHQAGLLHRDIKPDNVLLDVVTGRALLVDFGIAKRLDGAGTQQTQTGFVVGTPRYMSPEQALGQGALDARSDLYAFGAMLFQMVTGAPPYEGDSSQEIVGKHISEPVPVPRDRNARIPVWLSDIIVRALAKRPADRFQSAAQVLEAIRAGRATRSTEAVSAEVVVQRLSGAGPSLPVPAGPAPAGPPAPSASPAPSVSSVPPAAPLHAPGDRGTRWLPLMVTFGVVALVLGSPVVWFFLARRPSLRLVNRFDLPLELVLPDSTRAAIPPGTARNFRLPGGGLVRVLWSVAARPSPNGGPMGLPVSGELQLRSPRDSATEVGLGQARMAMFEPLITNHTDGALRIVVNAGLAMAQDCGCVVPPGVERYPIGFYPLYRNTSVRAVDSLSRQATFTNLGVEARRRGWRLGLEFKDRDFRRMP